MKKIFLTFLALIIMQPVLAISVSPDVFIIGADNSDEAIQQLSQINNLSMAEIEDRARPCAYSTWFYCSESGFLSGNENLIMRLVTDNDFVHSNGLTHAKLAEPLNIMLTLPETHCQLNDPEWPRLGGTCSWQGVNYTVDFIPYYGYQESIFDDEFRSNMDMIITNTATGQTISYSTMLVPYIREYGFYEGDTPFRLSPESIIQIFNIKNQ